MEKNSKGNVSLIELLIKSKDYYWICVDGIIEAMSLGYEEALVSFNLITIKYFNLKRNNYV